MHSNFSLKNIKGNEVKKESQDVMLTGSILCQVLIFIHLDAMYYAVLYK